MRRTERSEVNRPRRAHLQAVSRKFRLLTKYLAKRTLLSTIHGKSFPRRSRSYNVARRTQEIGVRMPLSARYAAVIWLVLRDSLAVVMLGTIIGLPSALLLSRYLDSLLFGLKSNDIATYATVSALLAAVRFLGALLPARRASRIDPLTALRCE